MSDMDYDEIQGRAGKFRCMELPGQPIMMHMGTSYLVGDLDKAVSKLRARVAELEQMESIGKGFHDEAVAERNYAHHKLSISEQRIAELEAERADIRAERDKAYTLSAEQDARIAELEAENERLECLCDIQYAAGVKAGWNYYAADDHAAMQKCIEMRQRDALPRLKELRMGLNSEDA